MYLKGMTASSPRKPMGSWWFWYITTTKVSADYQLQTNYLKGVNPRTAPMWMFWLFWEIAISLKLPVDEQYFKWNSNKDAYMETTIVIYQNGIVRGWLHCV